MKFILLAVFLNFFSNLSHASDQDIKKIKVQSKPIILNYEKVQKDLKTNIKDDFPISTEILSINDNDNISLEAILKATKKIIGDIK